MRLIGTLTFGTPNPKQYPCLGLALQAGARGGTYPAVLAAVDEVAVQHFLTGRIGFLDIPRTIDAALSSHDSRPDPTLEEVLAADAWARSFAEDWLKAKA
jgi:1-deoxy-D-xylulose-5-phosphate reductoisomerase